VPDIFKSCYFVIAFVFQFTLQHVQFRSQSVDATKM